MEYVLIAGENAGGEELLWPVVDEECPTEPPRRGIKQEFNDMALIEHVPHRESAYEEVCLKGTEEGPKPHQGVADLPEPDATRRSSRGCNVGEKCRP